MADGGVPTLRRWWLSARDLEAIKGPFVYGLWACVILLVLISEAQDPATGKSGFLSIHRDRGLAEMVGYAFALGAAVALIACWWRGRSVLYLGWATLITGVMLDDALGLHERGGEFLVDRLNLEDAAGLRGQDFGEMAVWSALGLVLGGFVMILHLRASRHDQRWSRSLALLLAALVFAAVVLDMLSIALDGSGRKLAGLLEDGGELFILATVLAYAKVLFGRETENDSGQASTSESSTVGAAG